MKRDWNKYINDHTIELDANYRGGVLKVDCSDLFPDKENPIIGASQNYLGGGMLGRVVGGMNFDPKSLKPKEVKLVTDLMEACKEYFHNITNHEDDEWESESYEQNQNKPESAY